MKAVRNTLVDASENRRMNFPDVPDARTPDGRLTGRDGVGDPTVAAESSTPEGAADRLASLAPSATATLAAMGAGDAVVGVTVHCPLDRPQIGGWLNPDYDRLADLDPDVVCTADPLQADIRDDLVERGYDVCHVEPDGLDAVIESFRALGQAVGRPDAGAALAAEARDRLAAVRERVPGPERNPTWSQGSDPTDIGAGTDTDDPRPVVYCEEWGDPPMAAGNWVPDAVVAAGGRYPFCDPGGRSQEVTRERVERADPEHVVIHHCGHGEAADSDILADRGWNVDADVHILDDDLLNQPSPALFDGIETLFGLFHGDR